LSEGAWKDKLSQFMIHPIWGVPFLLTVLWFGLYQFVGVFGAGTLVDWIENGIFVEYINPQVNAFFGALLGSLVAIILAVIHLFSDEWHGLGLIEVILFVGGSTGLGMAFAYWVPAVKRLLAGNTLLEQRVAQRAAQAFIAEEVFQTRDRTGILLFLSHLEHKVLVVGDSGINAKVHQSEWEIIVGKMVKGINDGRPADGLIEAIDLCGVLLHKQGVKRRKHDVNELPNRLRVGSARGQRRGRRRS